MPQIHSFRRSRRYAANGVRFAKNAILARAESLPRRFCFELSKQNLPILRATPLFALLGSGFSLFPLVVARRLLRAARDTRPATLGAAAPPLPKKFFDTFWEPYVRGTPLYDRGNSPSSPKPCGKSGEKSKSAILDFSRKFFR